jgi:hypothetical protein
MSLAAPSMPASKHRAWMWGLLLFAATVLAYFPAWTGRPVWDDAAHMTKTGLRSAAGLVRIWTELAGAVVLPLQAALACPARLHLSALAHRWRRSLAVLVSSRSRPGARVVLADARAFARAAGRRAVLRGDAFPGARLPQRLPVSLFVRGRSLPVPSQHRTHPGGCGWPRERCGCGPRAPMRTTTSARCSLGRAGVEAHEDRNESIAFRGMGRVPCLWERAVCGAPEMQR